LCSPVQSSVFVEGEVLLQIENLDLREQVPGPVGGSLARNILNWRKVTRDAWVLQAVSGCPITWTKSPEQARVPQFPQFARRKELELNKEVLALLHKGAIEEVNVEPGQFLGFIFPRPKKDGSIRPIFNLKELNQFIPYEHFKMEGVHLALDMVKANSWFTKLDLKDAYMSVLMAPNVRKFLRFLWRGKLYQYRTCPFGLASAPRMFTKILKPVCAILRRLGVQMVIYLDDMIFVNSDPQLLNVQTRSAVKLLQALGFVINWEKSQLQPAQTIEFLGFKLDAPNMKVMLPGEKVLDIQQRCRDVIQRQCVTARELAAVLGKLVAAVQAIVPGPLHYRKLQMSQAQALLQNSQNYETNLTLTRECKEELNWWVKEVENWNGRSLIRSSPDMVITTDASKKGWGAVCAGVTTQGLWSTTESAEHINVLELKAVLFAVKGFVKTNSPTHVHVRLDNTGAVANINKKGGTKSKDLLKVTQDLWSFCLKRKITLTAEHLPGVTNVQADHQSRVYKDSSNWRLEPKVFRQVSRKWGPFGKDLFADRLNRQLVPFVSWKPDPESEATDALSISWKGEKVLYAFPPFCLIMKCLVKAQTDEADMVIIAPVWQTQVWYGPLMQMLVDYPILLPPMEELLTGPRGEKHPLIENGTMQMGAWMISGKTGRTEDFLRRLSKSSDKPSDQAHSLCMEGPGQSGMAGARGEVWIPFKPLW
jgi:hypothetical protein